MPYFTPKNGAWVGDTYQYRIRVSEPSHREYGRTDVRLERTA
jgi:hypothetical protein